MRGIQPCGIIHFLRAFLILEDIRQMHGTDFHTIIQRPLCGQELQDICTKSAHGAFLQRDDGFMVSNEIQNHVRIERFGKARIGDGGGNALRFQHVSCFQRFGEATAQA